MTPSNLCPVCDQMHTSDPYDSHTVRGLPCQRCGQSIVFPVTYQGVGCFCSPQCAEMAVQAHAQRRSA